MDASKQVPEFAFYDLADAEYQFPFVATPC